MLLNLYLLKRPEDKVSYDEYDGFVIATDSEESARGMAKGDGTNGDDSNREGFMSWRDEEATCIFIGTTKTTKHSIILSSYNAG